MKGPAPVTERSRVRCPKRSKNGAEIYKYKFSFINQLDTIFIGGAVRRNEKISDCLIAGDLQVAQISGSELIHCPASIDQVLNEAVSMDITAVKTLGYHPYCAGCIDLKQTFANTSVYQVQCRLLVLGSKE